MSVTIGHNRPPLSTAEEIAERLATEHAALLERRDQLLAAARRFHDAYPQGIPDAGVQAKAADFAGGAGALNKFVKACEAQHTVEKQPYLEGGRAVDGFFKKLLIEPVAAARALVQQKMTSFAEAQAAAHPEAEPADATRVVGDMGTVVSLKENWVWETTDLMTLVKAVAEGRAPLSYLTTADSAIGRAVRSDGVRDIPGIRIYAQKKVW